MKTQQFPLEETTIPPIPATYKLESAINHFFDLSHNQQIGSTGFHQVMTAIHWLFSGLDEAEQRGVPSEEIRSRTKSIKAIHKRSPFFNRIQQWPRGYAGDFETIEYIIRQQNRLQEGSVEYWLEYIALNSPIAQQHRNKVHAQANTLLKAICETNNPIPKLLVIASGSSPDLALIQQAIKDRPFEVVLNDSDEDAIAYSVNRLKEITDKIQVVAGNAISSIKKFRRLGPFDQVVAGGLFDYLPDQVAIFLIRSVVDQLLTENGKFFLTNIANGNPYRVWIEYMADWHLIERSHEDMCLLIEKACSQGIRYTIEREGTGLTWLVSLEKCY